MEKLLEILLYIISTIIVSFTQVYTIYVLANIICKEVYRYKKLFVSFLYMLPIALFATFLHTYLIDVSFIKPTIIIITSCLIAHFVFHANIIKSIIISVIGVFIPFIFDMITVIILSVFVDSMDSIINNKFIYYTISIITSLIYGIFILCIDKAIRYKLNKIFVKTRKINYKFILYEGLIIILTLMPTMFFMFSNDYNYPATFVIINTIQLLVVSIFSFWYMEKRTLFKDTELELENTKLHNKALATINENIRGFKHDMGNMVQSINGYLAVGNIDGVKSYCKNLLHGFNDINLLSILSPKVINDPAIYGVVVSKMLYARDNNLTLSLDIACDVAKINFPSFELSRIIGILLDNAIEAALESKDRKLKLEMYYDENRKQDVIIIGNSVKNPSKIDVIKMFEKDYSTKENPSGFGLYEVLKFFKKNNKGDIVPNVDYDTKFFTQTLTFDK